VLNKWKYNHIHSCRKHRIKSLKCDSISKIFKLFCQTTFDRVEMTLLFVHDFQRKNSTGKLTSTAEYHRRDHKRDQQEVWIILNNNYLENPTWPPSAWRHCSITDKYGYTWENRPIRLLVLNKLNFQAICLQNEWEITRPKKQNKNFLSY